MEQINKIELLGNIGSVRIQEVSDSKVANFSVVTNFAYKNKEGCAVIDTVWHNVVAWEGPGMPDFEELVRGKVVHVLGRLRVRKYVGSDNVERLITEVVSSKFEIIETDEQPQVAQ